MTTGPKSGGTQINIDKILGSIPKANKDERATMKSNAEGWLTTGNEAQREAAKLLLDALDAQKQKEDAHTQAEKDQLRAEAVGRPLAESVVDAFNKLPWTKTEAALIQVLLDNPGLTSTALSVKMGWKDKSWHMKFGIMCKDRRDYFENPLYVEQREAYFWSGILADLETGNLFVMKPEAVKAFHELGLRRAS